MNGRKLGIVESATDKQINLSRIAENRHNWPSVNLSDGGGDGLARSDGRAGYAHDLLTTRPTTFNRPRTRPVTLENVYVI